MLYDYLYEKLAPSVLAGSFQGACSQKNVEILKDFLNEGKWRIHSPWDIEALNDFSSVVPPFVDNQYFGYRMNANAGSVIRFYLDIRCTEDERMVVHHNLYRQEKNALEIKGTGRYIFDALYLVGHATDIDKTESQGMRLMALKRVGTSRKLAGIVLTSDRTFFSVGREGFTDTCFRASPS